MNHLMRSSILFTSLLLARSVSSQTPCEKYSSYCHKNADCINILDNTSFVCTCKGGYTGDGKLVCSDYDECKKPEDNVCASKENGGSCVDHDPPQKYKCICAKGHIPDIDTLDPQYGPTKCIEVDMCASGSHSCDTRNGVCTDSYDDGHASYECGCKAGYEMAANNQCKEILKTVSEKQIDPCEKFPCNPENQICVLDAGRPKGRVCVCKTGWFAPSGYGGTCQSKNYCKNNEHNCDVNAECLSIPGSYICACNKGWQGSGFFCQDTNECEAFPNICGSGYACTNTIGSYYCTKTTDPPTSAPSAAATPSPTRGKVVVSSPTYKCPSVGFCNGDGEEVSCGTGNTTCTCLVDVNGIPTCGEPATPGDQCTSNSECGTDEFCMVDNGNCCHPANYCMPKCSQPAPGY